MVFQFGEYRIDVDVEKTRKFYRESSQTLTEGCGCIGCQNFVKAYESFDPQIKNFFETLGVDILKAPDMSAFHGNAKTNIMYYMGWCHLCGTVLHGESAWVPDTPQSGHWEETNTYAVTETCHVSFQEHCDLLEPEFPKPVIQMDVDIQVPWVLENVRHDWLV